MRAAVKCGQVRELPETGSCGIGFPKSGALFRSREEKTTRATEARMGHPPVDFSRMSGGGGGPAAIVVIQCWEFHTPFFYEMVYHWSHEQNEH